MLMSHQVIIVWPVFSLARLFPGRQLYLLALRMRTRDRLAIVRARLGAGAQFILLSVTHRARAVLIPGSREPLTWLHHHGLIRMTKVPRIMTLREYVLDTVLKPTRLAHRTKAATARASQERGILVLSC